jgi:Fic family protein
VKDVVAIFTRDRNAIENSGKSTPAVLTIHAHMQRYPIATTTSIKASCNLSLPTISRSLTVLESLGIVKEITGKDRYKIFTYRQYLDLLNKGTEPLPR